MQRFRKFLSRIFRGEGLLSVFAPVQHRHKGKIQNLYVVRTDFELKPEMRRLFSESLQPLRDRYGLDFIVLEPGIKLQRFDEL